MFGEGAWAIVMLALLALIFAALLLLLGMWLK